MIESGPSALRRFEEAAQEDFLSLGSDRVREALVRVAHGIPHDGPAANRQLSALVHACRQAGGERTPGRSFEAREDSGKTVPRPDCLADFHHELLAEKDGSVPLLTILARHPHPEDAAKFLSRRFPSLKGMNAFRFLAQIRFPTAIPLADTRRFVTRLGWLEQTGNSRQDQREFFTVLERAARLTRLSIRQVDFLFRTYSGAEKIEEFDTVCGRRPACSRCAIRLLCAHGRTVDVDSPVEPSYPIKEWNQDERPRERMMAGERLTNSELLAIILRTGSGSRSAVDLGRELMRAFGTLHELERASPLEIVEKMKGKGIGQAKAVEIKAALELGVRAAATASDQRGGFPQVNASQDIFERYRARFKSSVREEFLLLILNIKNRIQKEITLSIGTLNGTIVHPRDVFLHAMREAAASIIVVHNHPSGEPTPSREDDAVTRQLGETGKLVGIKLLDHVIIGAHTFYSYRDSGKLT